MSTLTPRPTEPGAAVAGTGPDPAQAAVLLFRRAPDHDHVTGRNLIVRDVSVGEPRISQDCVMVGALKILIHYRCCRRDAGLSRVPDEVVNRFGQAARRLVAGEPVQRRVAVRGWHWSRTAEIPQASVIQRRDGVVWPWFFPMTFEELAERGLRLAPFRHPRKAMVCTADRPQQGQRLVERLAAGRRPVQPQRGEQLDQRPGRQAGHRLRHLKAEPAQQAPDGRRPAAEVGGASGFWPGRKPWAAPTIAFES